jgi:hypothetical protein
MEKTGQSHKRAVAQNWLISGGIQINEIHFICILYAVMTFCGRPSHDAPLGRSKDGCPQSVEWLGLGGASDTLSQINPIFVTFYVTGFPVPHLRWRVDGGWVLQGMTRDAREDKLQTKGESHDHAD